MKVFRKCQLLLTLLLGVFLISCGKKGLPKPPEYLAPMPVTNFMASGSLEGVKVSWIPPLKNADGGDLKDLDRFFVYRSIVVKDESPEYELIQEIALVEELETTEKLNEKTGPRVYSYLDKDVKPGKEYDYYVVAVNQGGTKGKESPILRVTFIGQSSAVRIIPPNESEY